MVFTLHAVMHIAAEVLVNFISAGKSIKGIQIGDHEI